MLRLVLSVVLILDLIQESKVKGVWEQVCVGSPSEQSESVFAREDARTSRVKRRGGEKRDVQKTSTKPVTGEREEEKGRGC